MLHPYLHNNCSLLESWSSQLQNAQFQKIYSILPSDNFTFPIIRLVTTIILRFQVGLILISTRRNAHDTVTVTLAGTSVYKLIAWLAGGNKDYVLKLLGCVISIFVGVTHAMWNVIFLQLIFTSFCMANSNYRLPSLCQDNSIPGEIQLIKLARV